MGVAHGLGLSPEITAGAIISGAYFGDKMSPLSDTTNLAPAAAGSELFAHVRHMTWSTMPSITLALIGFTIIGLGAHPKVLDLDTGLGSLSHLIPADRKSVGEGNSVSVCVNTGGRRI